MKRKCLYCYKEISDSEFEFHPVCSKKFFGTEIPPMIDFDLNDIEELAVKTLGRNISLTGVQPKLSLEIKSSKEEGRRLTIVGFWGNYIFKPPFAKYPEMPENEDLTMHLAEQLKIKTAEHSLIRLKSGELGYISKRFDRTKIEKLHQEDMAQLIGNLTERKYSGSMEKIGKIILKHSTFSGNDVLRLFELILFCFITGNADMHLKNFSLLYSEDDEILFSPAYDLLATKLLLPEDKEELALTLNGKKSNLRKSDFDKFASSLGINEVALSNVYKKFTSSLNSLYSFIDKSFLADDTKEKYKDLINKRMKVLS